MSQYGISSVLLRWHRQAYSPDERQSKSRVYRSGKTKRDRNSGAHAKNAENKMLRAQWQQDNRAKLEDFPWHTCNGKRNRNQWTGKRGNRVIVDKRTYPK